MGGGRRPPWTSAIPEELAAYTWPAFESPVDSFFEESLVIARGKFFERIQFHILQLAGFRMPGVKDK